MGSDYFLNCQKYTKPAGLSGLVETFSMLKPQYDKPLKTILVFLLAITEFDFGIQVQDSEHVLILLQVTHN